MINVTGTPLLFNFRHDRLIPYDMPPWPVSRAELCRALAAVYEAPGRNDYRREADALLERYALEGQPYSHVTTCRVSLVAARDVPLFETMALCSRFDNFSRRTGRWYTITRAVDALRDFKAGDDVCERFLASYFCRFGSGPRAVESAEHELKQYVEWHDTTYQTHQKKAVTTDADDICPVCSKPVTEDRWPVAEAPFDGSATETVLVPIVYHRACYVAIHPPAPELPKVVAQ